MKLVLTYHAKQRMAQHAISKEQIKRCIKQGSKTPQTGGFKAVYGYLEVAYKMQGELYIIKTIIIRK